jgi:hypothetical protein
MLQTEGAKWHAFGKKMRWLSNGEGKRNCTNWSNRIGDHAEEVVVYLVLKIWHDQDSRKFSDGIDVLFSSPSRLVSFALEDGLTELFFLLFGHGYLGCLLASQSLIKWKQQVINTTK